MTIETRMMENGRPAFGLRHLGLGHDPESPEDSGHVPLEAFGKKARDGFEKLDVVRIKRVGFV